MPSKLDRGIRMIFTNVQYNKTCHHNEMNKIRKLYDKNTLDVFWECFLFCLKIPLTVAQRHPHVENTLEFASKFAVSLYSFSNDQTLEPMCPFLDRLFNFLLTYHGAKDPSVRFRICHFLNMLLNSMGDNAFIDDELCDKITNSMMERLMDKSSKVRAQAVLALHRLQDPSNEDCPVIKMFLFHLCKDPNPEVRRAVLTSMAKNQQTLQAAIKKTRDVDERVRKLAYEFISKITVRSLTMKHRDQLLNDGLKDRSNIVRNCVEKVLLPSWLMNFKGEYINLIKALDAEIATETSILVLQTLFKSAPLTTIIEQAPIDQITKLIPIENLSSENVLYWRCLCTFLNTETYTDKLELVLPELSKFCAYIQNFIDTLLPRECDTWERQTRNFILLQLFEIARVYDLSDEVGRQNLKTIILNTLTMDSLSTKIIECIVKHLETVIPDAISRINTLNEVIGDIRLPMKETDTPVVPMVDENERHMLRAKLNVKLIELRDEEHKAVQKKDYTAAESFKIQIMSVQQELSSLSEKPQEIIADDNQKEKDDPETMIKCLTIMYTMMQAESVTFLTPTLRTLLQIVLECIDHPNDAVHILALKTIGVYCILDKELAKKYIMMFFLQLSLEYENRDIWVVVLKAIFDLLLLYGFEYFDMINNDINDTVQDKTGRNRTVKLYTNEDDEQSSSLTSNKQNESVENNCSFIKILMGLLDNVNGKIRNVATEGLCKLLLKRRISGSGIISRLIILSYNPANETDIFIRQCLSSFFDLYVTIVPESSETLEEAFYPTLRILCNAPETSPLQEIDPYDVAKFILSLTRVSVGTNNKKMYCPHNNLAFTILAEILNPNSKIEKEALIKSLKNLYVQVEDNATKQDLLDGTNKVLDMVQKSEKRLIKYVSHFKLMLEKPESSENVENGGNENNEIVSDESS